MKMFRDQSGQGMVEYGLIIALIAIAAIVAVGFLGDEIVAVFNQIGTALRGTPAP
jgi:pilus assembly protein Flp/PilA